MSRKGRKVKVNSKYVHTLLEKGLIAPVEKALYYRFYDPYYASGTKILGY